MRERMMSMQLARAREIFKYYSCFYVCVLTAGTIALVTSKKIVLTSKKIVYFLKNYFLCLFQLLLRRYFKAIKSNFGFLI